MADQDPLFVKSKVREYLKAKDCNTAGDVVDGKKLNTKIMEILDEAAERAKENGRKTVKPRDL